MPPARTFHDFHRSWRGCSTTARLVPFARRNSQERLRDLRKSLHTTFSSSNLKGLTHRGKGQNPAGFTSELIPLGDIPMLKPISILRKRAKQGKRSSRKAPIALFRVLSQYGNGLSHGMSPNENKISDGCRKRASIEVEVF